MKIGLLETGYGKATIALLIVLFWSTRSEPVHSHSFRETRTNTVYGGIVSVMLYPFVTVGYQKHIFEYSFDVRVFSVLLMNGVGVGFKYFHSMTSSHSFTAGVHQDIVLMPDSFFGPGFQALSATIGHDYLSGRGFNLFADVGMSIIHRTYETFPLFCFALGAGYSF